MRTLVLLALIFLASSLVLKPNHFSNQELHQAKGQWQYLEVNNLTKDAKEISQLAQKEHHELKNATLKVARSFVGVKSSTYDLTYEQGKNRWHVLISKPNGGVATTSTFEAVTPREEKKQKPATSNKDSKDSSANASKDKKSEAPKNESSVTKKENKGESNDHKNKTDNAVNGKATPAKEESGSAKAGKIGAAPQDKSQANPKSALQGSKQTPPAATSKQSNTQKPNVNTIPPAPKN